MNWTAGAFVVSSAFLVWWMWTQMKINKIVFERLNTLSKVVMGQERGKVGPCRRADSTTKEAE